jgi:hypothetical protein
MGIGDPAEVATIRSMNASNYIRKKCVGAPYTLGNTLPLDIALGRIFSMGSSRCFSSVSPSIFTLDRLSLHEKCRLNITTIGFPQCFLS